MIRKRYDHEDLIARGTVELTDEHGGSGRLRLEGVGPSRWVQDPTPPGQPYWYGTRGHHEWDSYKVIGSANPEWENTFGLKLYEEGFVLSSSIAGATVFPTKEEAAALATRWLAEGGPGLTLESPEETAARKRIERSSHTLPKITRQLSMLVDEDLRRLSEAALRTITKREENAAKEVAKAEAKRAKAAEKARLAAEKAAKKQAAAEARAAKAAEKAAKAAEREAKKAAKAASTSPAAMSA